MYQSAVKDPISAAYACDFWASMDHGTRGTDLRAIASVLRQPTSKATEDAWAAIARLKGEATVMVNLLQEAFTVLETVDGQDAEECERLMDLHNKIKRAIHGAISGMMTMEGVK